MKNLWISLLVLPVIILSCSSQKKSESAGTITPSAGFPGWAAPEPTEMNEDRIWRVMGDPRQSTLAMRESIKKTRYLVENNLTSPSRPFMMLKLGGMLTDIEQDRVALHTLIQTRLLPPDTPYNRKIWGHPTLATVQRKAAIDQARILARNGVKTAAALFDTVGPLTGYDLLRKAEVHMLLGQKDEAYALLAAPRLDGHTEKRFSIQFITMRAVSIARSLGLNPLAKDLTEDILNQPMDKEKWPQWQSPWQILQDFKVTAENGRNWWESPLRDGVFTGSSMGYVDQITVKVTVQEGTIADVKVADTKENRPYSSQDIIPHRIVKKQSLAVDAVTGATITSCAIMAAVDKALSGTR